MTDVVFSRQTCRRPQPTSNDPILIWASGLPTTDRQIHAGWISEVGKHEEFDRACYEIGLQTVKIKHGGGAVVEHWKIDYPNFFVLCDGIQTLYEATNKPDERYGIALDWDEQRGRSVLKMKVFLRGLCELGAFIPLIISVKSRFTADILSALEAHLDVIDVMADLARQKGKDTSFPFYACDISLFPPADPVMRGQAGKQKEVYPIVTDIPEKDKIDRQFALDRYIQPEWVAEIENRLDDVIAWSKIVSAAIRLGSET